MPAAAGGHYFPLSVKNVQNDSFSDIITVRKGVFFMLKEDIYFLPVV